MSGFNKYCGVYPVVPTPLKEDESLDLAGLEHLVEYYIIEGCHGLLILGSGGESPIFHSMKNAVLSKQWPKK